MSAVCLITLLCIVHIMYIIFFPGSSQVPVWSPETPGDEDVEEREDTFVGKAPGGSGSRDYDDDSDADGVDDPTNGCDEVSDPADANPDDVYVAR
jgi:hypothetical protein